MSNKDSTPAYDEGLSSAPPAYSSLNDRAVAEMNSLAIGDPHETICVPMILSTEQKRKRDIWFPVGNKASVIKRSVVVRKMTREHYLKHYAKDSRGNFIGTDKPAVDAGLVFVPGKSSDEEILEQVHKVAFGKEHGTGDFGYSGPVAGGAAC